jgi:uncharacterized SAM-binding protein YcdF (DUF218 family)
VRFARRRRIAIAAGLALVVLIAATAWLFFAPPTDEAAHADAVVVLGPGSGGERFERAMKLMNAGAAPVLVVSEGHAQNVAEHGLCRQPDRAFQVVCFQAEPFSTRGEARMVSQLAAARAWRSLIVVTSTYHVVRARMLFRRCYHGRFAVVGASPPIDGRLVRDVAHEWLGLVYALTAARGC